MLFHIIMCLVTGGLWIPVMIICIVHNTKKAKKYTKKIERNTRR